MTHELDQVLATACHLSGGVQELLDGFFEFLGRRTDFYEHEDECKEYVLRAFNKYLPAPKPTPPSPRLDPGPTTKTRRTLGVQSERFSGGSGGVVIETVSSSEENDLLYQLSKGIPHPPNGMNYKRYRWTQTLDSVDIVIPTRQRIGLGRISIKLLTHEVIVKLDCHVVLAGHLFEPIDTADSTWTIVDGRTIEIMLCKRHHNTWWLKLLSSDAESIPQDSIQPEEISSLKELDPETARAVSKMVEDQKRQKTLSMSVESENLYDKYLAPR
ncbi:putative nuclear migration nudc protein [Gregarina niphandrodes]|uniref:Nuclear migration protein nudC n=1 Tax=Gregarina niphandrodes TaxID=110365 RepID=A0A023B1K2_GRENI|nr:putative nuclear migration nudc protein [Gregarina niphandrodes]EZG46115.1 putative nuclear migration nudc protein [Gregarina niphandrodes]|eukprot:XP_011132371.1 putative nuclear migration nudc protein [Gregarina niphandrodes]